MIDLYHGTSTRLLPGILSSGLRDPYLTSSLDLALYFAECAAGEDRGEMTVLSVSVSPENLRMDFALMDEPVGHDGADAGDYEEAVRDCWNHYGTKHPEWVRDGLICIPAHRYDISLSCVHSCRHEGTVPATNIRIHEPAKA